jgi:hypothetical protein
MHVPELTMTHVSPEQRKPSSILRRNRRANKISTLLPRSVPYTGPPVGCTYCSYEAPRGRRPAPAATRLVRVRGEARELCADHARTAGLALA